jgi:predicted DNA-binding transcriptional regulator AlpA
MTGGSVERSTERRPAFCIYGPAALPIKEATVPTKIKPKAKAKAKRPQSPAPRRYHLDRRVHQILAAGRDGADDELLSTQQVAQWFGVSEQWLEIARARGDGPRYVMLSARTIKYRRSDCRAFLDARTHASTREYR